MKISINQAKILYAIVNGQRNFQPGDFGTDSVTFQSVARAIADLQEKKMLTSNEPHIESTSGNRYIDMIMNCRLTKRGEQELDQVTGDFLNSEGKFSQDTWS
jgi:hypothetical protein